MEEMTTENQIPVSAEDAKAIDDALGLVAVSFRIPIALYEQYAIESARTGIPIQVLFRQQL